MSSTITQYGKVVVVLYKNISYYLLSIKESCYIYWRNTIMRNRIEFGSVFRSSWMSWTNRRQRSIMKQRHLLANGFPCRWEELSINC